MSHSVELEIQTLLNEKQSSQDIATHLLQRLQTYPDQFSSEDQNALFQFLLNAQLPHLLIEFVLNNFEDQKILTPWPFFLQALGLLKAPLTEDFLQALTEGLKEDQAELNASRADNLDAQFPLLGEWRAQRKQKNRQDSIAQKKSLLEQMITLRTQQLYEQEKKVLVSLQKRYPGDPEILKATQDLKERHALDIIQRRAPATTAFKEHELIHKDPEVEKAQQALATSLLEKAVEFPELTFDFAILAFMIEDYDVTLQLIDLCEDSTALWWFKVEILILSKRYVQALEALPQIELLLAHDPETFFATAYYRAQCLWGLGQKHAARETLESLLAARPHYRAASALQSLWGAP